MRFAKKGTGVFLLSLLLMLLCCGCSSPGREDALTIETDPDAVVSEELILDAHAADSSPDASGQEDLTEEAESGDASLGTDGQQDADALEEEEPSTGVTTERVNLREGPGQNYNVVRVIEGGTQVQILGEEDEWVQVQAGEDTGYLFAEYVSRGQQTAQPEDVLTVTGTWGAGRIVVIDPGHQAQGDSTQEPNGPGSSVMKARVTGGTRGRTTGVYEYELNLDVSLQLKSELESRGYTVYMTRETHDVNISNMERAQFATEVGADAVVRIHANGVEDSSVSGALSMAPSTSNPYCAQIAEDSQLLARCVIDAYCAATGMNNQGVSISDTMSGMNWSTVPVTILEMGYMTNPADDTNMQDDGYQLNMVRGIADGVDAYFAQK